MILRFFKTNNPKDNKNTVLVNGNSMTQNEYSAMLFTIILLVIEVFILIFLKNHLVSVIIKTDFILVGLICLIVVCTFYIYKLEKERRRELKNKIHMQKYLPDNTTKKKENHERAKNDHRT